ncbi:MAG: hypothetical protein V7K54_01925 [Nostoc sp.]
MTKPRHELRKQLQTAYTASVRLFLVPLPKSLDVSYSILQARCQDG